MAYVCGHFFLIHSSFSRYILFLPYFFLSCFFTLPLFIGSKESRSGKKKERRRKEKRVTKWIDVWGMKKLFRHHFQVIHRSLPPRLTFITLSLSPFLSFSLFPFLSLSFFFPFLLSRSLSLPQFFCLRVFSLCKRWREEKKDIFEEKFPKKYREGERGRKKEVREKRKREWIDCMTRKRN